MTPELYKRWRLGLGFTSAKELATYLDMAAISVSTYESRGSGPAADDRLLRILEQKVLNRSDDFINAVVDTAIRFGVAVKNNNPQLEQEKISAQTLEKRIADLESKVHELENLVLNNKN